MIRLRPLEEGDVELVWRGWQFEDIRQSILLEDDATLDLQEAMAFVFFSRGKGSSGRDMAIECDGAFAGCLMWHYGKGFYSQMAEIGYWVLPEHRGRGIATQAIEEAMRFLFDTRGVHRIQAQVFAGNAASECALQRAGFVHEATLTDLFFLEEKRYDCHVYAAIAQDKSPE